MVLNLGSQGRVLEELFGVVLNRKKGEREELRTERSSRSSLLTPARLHLQGFPECLNAAALLSRPNTQRVSLQGAFRSK